MPFETEQALLQLVHQASENDELYACKSKVQEAISAQAQMDGNQLASIHQQWEVFNSIPQSSAVEDAADRNLWFHPPPGPGAPGTVAEPGILRLASRPDQAMSRRGLRRLAAGSCSPGCVVGSLESVAFHAVHYRYSSCPAVTAGLPAPASGPSSDAAAAAGPTSSSDATTDTADTAAVTPLSAWQINAPAPGLASMAVNQDRASPSRSDTGDGGASPMNIADFNDGGTNPASPAAGAPGLQFLETHQQTALVCHYQK